MSIKFKKNNKFKKRKEAQRLWGIYQEHLKVKLKISHPIHNTPQNFHSHVSFILRTLNSFPHTNHVGECRMIIPKHVSLCVHKLKILTVKAEEAHFGFCCHIIPSNLEKANFLILAGFLWWSFLQDINTLNCKNKWKKQKKHKIWTSTPLSLLQWTQIVYSFSKCFTQAFYVLYSLWRNNAIFRELIL